MGVRRMTHDDELEDLERRSGIPSRRGLGASRNELIALGLAILVFVLIAAAFWWQSTR